jgi:hypothetical protein
MERSKMMDHAITVADVLKIAGIGALIVVPLALFIWFISTIDFSK